MAKRSRRKGNKSPRAGQARTQIAAETVEPQSTQVNLDDYRYVVADLRRVAILAAALFALLVALSFVIR